ncbi:MAG: hypothetical protein EDM05_050825 [Leptolyngbya sp. IPPAS B-1204]
MTLTDLATVLAVQASAPAFPGIHAAARLARVPVIMYHDILPTKQVFFDVTPPELEADLQLIQKWLNADQPRPVSHTSTDRAAASP